MFKLLLQLVVAALVASAVWRLGSAYVEYFKFTDGVREAALYENKSDSELRTRILELADEFDVPLDPAPSGDPTNSRAVTIRREQRHLAIEGSYVKPIELLPGYLYPWRFSWKVDADAADVENR